MTKTNEQWQESPAKNLTLGTYLPERADNPVRAPISDSEVSRQSSVIDIVQTSGDELGRNSAERRLYLQTVGEKYGQVSFLATAHELTNLLENLEKAGSSLDQQDDTVKNAVKSDMEKLALFTESIFGTVDDERFASISQTARMKATRILAEESGDPQLKASARHVLEVFPDPVTKPQEKSYAPSQELLDEWRPVIEEMYAPLLSLLDESKETYSSEELQLLFERGIQSLANDYGVEAGAAEWQVAIRGAKLKIDHETKTVWVPADKSYSFKLAKEMLVHEIGGHLYRVLKGGLTGDALLNGDMPGRSRDEEALLVAFEQILSGEPRESGLTYYVAVALANGQLGMDKVPLKDLTPIVLDYLAVSSGHVLNEKQVALQSHRVHRVTRGMPSFVMDGQLYQVTFNEDLKYALGQENAVAFLENNRHRKASALADAFIGRTAYSNPRHIEYARSKAP